MQNCTSYLACNFATSWRIWPKLCTIVKLIPGQYTFKGLVNRASGKKVIARQSFEIFSVDEGGPLWVKFAVEFYRVLWTILGAPGAPISGLSSPNVFTPFSHFPIFDLRNQTYGPPTLTLLFAMHSVPKTLFSFNDVAERLAAIILETSAYSRSKKVGKCFWHIWQWQTTVWSWAV